MTQNTLVFTGQDGKQPWFTKFGVMIMLDHLFLGSIQRFNLYYKSYIVHHELKKHITI